MLAWRAKTRDTSRQPAAAPSAGVQLLRRESRPGRKPSRVAMEGEDSGRRGGRKGGSLLIGRAVLAKEVKTNQHKGVQPLFLGFARLRGRGKSLFARLARGWARRPCEAKPLPNRDRKLRSGGTRDTGREQGSAGRLFRIQRFTTTRSHVYVGRSACALCPIRPRRGPARRSVPRLFVDRHLRLSDIGSVRGLSLW